MRWFFPGISPFGNQNQASSPAPIGRPASPVNTSVQKVGDVGTDRRANLLAGGTAADEDADPKKRKNLLGVDMSQDFASYFNYSGGPGNGDV